MSFQALSSSINNVLNAIDKSLAERDQNVDKFCAHLDKDIQELTREVKVVKRESQNPVILDVTADQDSLRTMLQQMQEKMDELQKRAFLFRSYQKNFKVEVTKYDELEEVHAELKLKQLLWDSVDEWDKLIAEWCAVSTVRSVHDFGPICTFACDACFTSTLGFAHKFLSCNNFRLSLRA